MNDYFDDFDNDFGDDFMDDDPNDGFMEDDFMEDSFDENYEPEDLSNDGSGIEDEQSDEICEDEFTANEVLMFGVGMGFAYEEGLEEAERRKLEKKINDD